MIFYPRWPGRLWWLERNLQSRKKKLRTSRTLWLAFDTLGSSSSPPPPPSSSSSSSRLWMWN